MGSVGSNPTLTASFLFIYLQAIIEFGGQWWVMPLEFDRRSWPSILYRRHLRIAGKCVGIHPPDTRSYEPDELRRGWKKCVCPIYARGTLNGQFSGRNTEQFRWDEARAVASALEL
jgi:hypothetical protein